MRKKSNTLVFVTKLRTMEYAQYNSQVVIYADNLRDSVFLRPYFYLNLDIKNSNKHNSIFVQQFRFQTNTTKV